MISYTNLFFSSCFVRCWLVDTYMSFGLPYMLYDIGAMYASYHRDAEAKQNAIISKKLTFVSFLNRQKLIITHHLLVAFVGYPIALVRSSYYLSISLICSKCMKTYNIVRCMNEQ